MSNKTLLTLALLSLTTLHASVPVQKPIIGFAEMQGRRKTMEDEHCALTQNVGGKDVQFYGVFDGHAGDRAAKFAKAHLHENIFASSHFAADPVAACIEGCETTDEKILTQGYQDGSCVICAMICDDKLYAINLGDSRAMVCSGGKTIALSDDQKPNRPDELARIKAAGGFVAVYGVPRVGGRLAIARALGDASLKAPALAQSWVSATPEVMTYTLTEQDEFLLLACDGVWDVMSNEQAVKIVRDALASGKSLTEAAKKLRDTTYKMGSGDNISVMIVPLNN